MAEFKYIVTINIDTVKNELERLLKESRGIFIVPTREGK
jgi:hypothetical protein